MHCIVLPPGAACDRCTKENLVCQSPGCRGIYMIYDDLVTLETRADIIAEELRERLVDQRPWTFSVPAEVAVLLPEDLLDTCRAAYPALNWPQKTAL